MRSRSESNGLFSFRAVTVAVLPLMSQGAWAAADSVGVFHRPEKVIVLVQERGVGTRLQSFMNQWGNVADLRIGREEDSVKIRCARSTEAVSCTFRFLPSAFVQIGQKESHVKLTSEEADGLPQTEFAMTFESSRGHRFELHLKNGALETFARRP